MTTFKLRSKYPTNMETTDHFDSILFHQNLVNFILFLPRSRWRKNTQMRTLIIAMDAKRSTNSSSPEKRKKTVEQTLAGWMTHICLFCSALQCRQFSFSDIHWTGRHRSAGVDHRHYSPPSTPGASDSLPDMKKAATRTPGTNNQGLDKIKEVSYYVQSIRVHFIIAYLP
jgi:hypothetical protein